MVFTEWIRCFHIPETFFAAITLSALHILLAKTEDARNIVTAATWKIVSHASWHALAFFAVWKIEQS
jgi:hypothetical protein